MPFAIGARVRRLENREVTGATVKSVTSTTSEGVTEYIYEIDYDEGGSGWWPESSLVAE
jgi:hypothetical protein